MASPGFGKRSAPHQAPRSRADFAHLPAREASIAAYIDRLPEGAAIDVKTLAKEIPDYGQQAVGTALRNLSEVGHLRRFRERRGDGATQWVSRTYFSRTPRDDAWWETFRRGDVPAEEPPPKPQRPERSTAYAALAALGRVDPRMMLSAAECEALESLAEEWFARGATAQELTHALTTGLPTPVHSPGAFARRRLRDKMPPERAPEPTPTPRRVPECTGCGRPGPPEALPGGLCRLCRGEPAATVQPPEDGDSLAAVGFAELMQEMRSTIREQRGKAIGPKGSC
ncbi:hypothetical protein I5Q34_13630 [Streptomyces sp. AV19]|uniref:hypothetical protein n=1 Tax=Streptomyces sp. AV19 TaxID=2793068 RepID=UPI0018FE5315|nr:hypothetical protein [Streptomyces sp. AV19]MBH1935300.1 hypothetical protein [Streptomyces sp. AV19]MDG4531185.1 hypothetical protein [Streptomyces sp. AV19]